MLSTAGHVEEFCEAFLIEKKRKRLAVLLSGRRRGIAVTELVHSDFLVEGCKHDLKQFDQEGIFLRFEELGAKEDNEVYLISNDERLDDRLMGFRPALEAVLGIGLGTVISIVPGRLALFEGERGPADRFLLHAGKGVSWDVPKGT